MANPLFRKQSGNTESKNPVTELEVFTVNGE
jgi:hypothetical protein